MSECETGGYFSRAYLKRDAPSSDSKKLRKRLEAYFRDLFRDESYEFGEFIEIELGLIVLERYNNFLDWEDVFSNQKIEDVLDIVTAAHRFLFRSTRGSYNTKIVHFSEFVERAFREEFVSYRIDEKGGIHPFIDVAFVGAFSSVINELADPRLSAAKHYIEQAERCLLATQLDTRMAVRATFDAAENLFKLICTGQTQLNKTKIQQNLIPILLDAAPSEHERRALGKLMDSFIGWIESGHFYRHEPGNSKPEKPSFEFAVLYLTQGFGYIRFLAIACKAADAKQGAGT